MNYLRNIVTSASKRARVKRAKIFREQFRLDGRTKILDLGSEDGSNIALVLDGTPVIPENVYIADISATAVQEGAEKYNFNPVLIGESGRLNFEDGFFDVVYCSSVIEHVSIAKSKIWQEYSGSRFRTDSAKSQAKFAKEIARVGKGYFVQTPYKHFPIESHSWLPFLAWLPRPLLIPTLKVSNTFWIKKTTPDWNLLNKRQLAALFQGANIVSERVFGITKSIMAIKN